MTGRIGLGDCISCGCAIDAHFDATNRSIGCAGAQRGVSLQQALTARILPFTGRPLVARLTDTNPDQEVA